MGQIKHELCGNTYGMDGTNSLEVKMLLHWSEERWNWKEQHAKHPSGTTLHMLKMCNAKLTWAWQRFMEARGKRIAAERLTNLIYAQLEELLAADQV